MRNAFDDRVEIRNSTSKRMPWTDIAREYADGQVLSKTADDTIIDEIADMCLADYQNREVDNILYAIIANPDHSVMSKARAKSALKSIEKKRLDFAGAITLDSTKTVAELIAEDEKALAMEKKRYPDFDPSQSVFKARLDYLRSLTAEEVAEHDAVVADAKSSERSATTATEKTLSDKMRKKGKKADTAKPSEVSEVSDKSDKKETSVPSVPSVPSVEKSAPEKTDESGNTVLFSKQGDLESEITEEQKKIILDAYDYAMNGDPVIELIGNEFQKDGIPLTEKVTKYYQEQYNGIAIHPELGEVKLDLEGVKDSLGHGIGKIKAAAYAAVPKLIEKGKIFDRQKNWKNRGYDTVVMIAPLKINGVDYIGEVVVEQRPNRQGFYLHEVEIKEKLADVFKTPTEGSTPPVSKLIISQWLAKINPASSKNPKNSSGGVQFSKAGDLQTEQYAVENKLPDVPDGIDLKSASQVRNYLREAFAGRKFRIDSDGRLVAIDFPGIRSGVEKRGKSRQSLFDMENIVKNSYPVGYEFVDLEHLEKSQDINGQFIYTALINVDGQPFVATIKLDDHYNEEYAKFKDIGIKEMASAVRGSNGRNNSANPPAQMPRYTIRELVDFVKQNFKENPRFTENILSDFSERLDQAYFSAVNRGDMKTAQKMVENAAKRAGYTIEAYHGAEKDFGFTVFKPGEDRYGDYKYPGGTIFLTNRLDIAATYSGKHDGESRISDKTEEGNYAVFINPGKQYIVENKGKFNRRLETPKDINQQYFNTNEYAEYAREKGFDSIVFKEIYDIGMKRKWVHPEGEKYGHFKTPEGTMDIYGIFDSNRIKSADPIVYDNNGNIIPLSERFNPEKDDIRFSLTGDLDLGDTSLSPEDYRRSIDPLFDFVMEYTDGVVNPGNGHIGEEFTGSYISPEYKEYSVKRKQGAKESDASYQRYLARREESLKLKKDRLPGGPIPDRNLPIDHPSRHPMSTAKCAYPTWLKYCGNGWKDKNCVQNSRSVP